MTDEDSDRGRDTDTSSEAPGESTHEAVDTSSATTLLAQTPEEDAAVETPAESTRIVARAEGPSEFPPDYYVTLQPVTIPFISHQLDRLDIKYKVVGDSEIAADYDAFQIRVVLDTANFVNLRGWVRSTFAVGAIGALGNRCNWWNAHRRFVKASCVVQAPKASLLQNSAPATMVPSVRIALDFELPAAVGLAPVQFQDLFLRFVRNVNGFITDAHLELLQEHFEWD